MEVNYGLLTQEREFIKDYRMGGLTGLSQMVLTDGDWSDYLPVFERQNNAGFDRLACVTYAELNCLEIIYKRLQGREVNFSDRFTAKSSGTTKQGNYLREVAENIRLNGVVFEQDYPDDATSWDEYYKTLDLSLITKASKSLGDFDFGWEWVEPTRDNLLEALRFSPLAVTVKFGSTRYNHCITLYSADNGYKCFDHYLGRETVLYDKNYQFGSAMRFELKVKSPMSNHLNLQNNTLVQLVEGKGGVGLYLDGAILIGPLEKVQFAWLMRNAVSELDGHKASVIQADWDKYEKRPLP